MIIASYLILSDAVNINVAEVHLDDYLHHDDDDDEVEDYDDVDKFVDGVNVVDGGDSLDDDAVHDVY